MSLEVDSISVSRIYQQLNKIGNLGARLEDGFLRAGYSQEESAAIELIVAECKALSMEVAFDALGNFSATTPSQSGQYIEFASHIDTVPHGGNFDGAAGVVAGLEAVRALKDAPARGEHGLRLRIWRLEESSTYNIPCFGSRAAFGLVEPAALTRRFGTTSLAEAIELAGFASEPVRSQQATISASERDSILAHFELHIEQAAHLERSNLDIGIITSIRGPKRVRICVEGRFDHSGGTPMGTPHRADANLALAYMLSRVDAHYYEQQAESKDIVQTVGVINSDAVFNAQEPRVYQNAAPKISGFAYFIYEVRGSDSGLRDSYYQSVKTLLLHIAEEFGVTLTFDELSASDGIPTLDVELQRLLTTSCDQLHISYEAISSGAMHDAAIVATQKRSDGSSIPVGMIFIPCRDGISHNPREYTSYEAIAKGASVLALSAHSLGAGSW